MCLLNSRSIVNKLSNLQSFVYSSNYTIYRILLPTDELPTPEASLSNIVFSESDVFTALTSLDPSKAMGIDCLGPKILKKCALALYQPVHHLFSLSLLNHYIPEEWRVHRITPVFKSGDRSSVKNYLCFALYQRCLKESITTLLTLLLNPSHQDSLVSYVTVANLP